MTLQQAHLVFKQYLDKGDSLNSANFLPEEIDLAISDAQEQFIEQRAYGYNFQNKHLEETQKRVKDLQSITQNAVISTSIVSADNKPNGRFIELPTDYRHAIQEDVTVKYLDCNNKLQSTNIQVIPLQHDKYNKMIVNPFTVPSLDKVYRLPYGRFGTPPREHFEILLGPNQTFVSYNLRYLKNPRKLNLANLPTVINGITAPNAELDMTDESYREIIRLAAETKLYDIESQRAQAEQEQFKTIE